MSIVQDALKSFGEWSRSRKSARRKRLHHRLVEIARDSRAPSSATFIGITGSSAKTTTTALLSHILAARGSVKTQVAFNTMSTLSKTLARPVDADFLVAEVALGKPDDVKEMAELLQPDIAIVTMIGLEHYSQFRTLDSIAAEKGALVSAVRPGGFAVLNHDDPHVMAMAGRTKERVVTFGRSSEARYTVTDIRVAFPVRLSMTVEWPGGRVELKTQYAAEHFWLPVAAAVAAALELGVPPETVAERVAACEPFSNRMEVIEAAGGPAFLVDTVKAPWHSLALAYKALADANAPRKRIVLGHMSDFPGSDSKYRKAYVSGREVADQVLFVGDHAHRAKASAQDQNEARFKSFREPREVAEHIRETATVGEVILLKGSKDLHLERIALSMQSDVKCWIPACRRSITCQACGLYGLPYEQHHGREDWHKRERKRLLRRPWKLLPALLRTRSS
jgi:UDP-N-acetylmuramoyl-tripeptide--D-alanyl-D-alanine ligase